MAVLQKAYRISNLLGSALRLVFHDAGEVDIRTSDLFGSDGCLSDSGPNSGLKEKNTIAMTIIDPYFIDMIIAMRKILTKIDSPGLDTFPFFAYKERRLDDLSSKESFTEDDFYH